MKFIIIHHTESKEVVGVVVQTPHSINYVAKGEASLPLEVLLTRGRVVVEEKDGSRTILRREVERGDHDYLNFLRYKLNVPLVSTTIGSSQEFMASRAMNLLWNKFGKGPMPEMKNIPV